MQNSGQQIRRKNAGIMPKNQENGAESEEKRIERCNLEKSGQEITEKLQKCIKKGLTKCRGGIIALQQRGAVDGRPG